MYIISYFRGAMQYDHYNNIIGRCITLSITNARFRIIYFTNADEAVNILGETSDNYFLR